MGMTFHTSPLKMAITILINMTQRTRNHSMEFLLSLTATTVTRKPKEATSRLLLQFYSSKGSFTTGQDLLEGRRESNRENTYYKPQELQQGGSQHGTRARGILSFGKPKETDYNK